MIEPKERFRRFTVRLKTLFNIPEYDTYIVDGKTKRNKKLFYARIPVNIPNFWYTPFEVYVLAHLQRAHFIMTCNEWAYVDASTKAFDKYFVPSEKYRKEIYEWQTKQMEERISQFAERIKKKDENTNTQTESDN
jgi:3-methyladenine DNA glycosylase AlkD